MRWKGRAFTLGIVLSTANFFSYINGNIHSANAKEGLEEMQRCKSALLECDRNSEDAARILDSFHQWSNYTSEESFRLRNDNIKLLIPFSWYIFENKRPEPKKDRQCPKRGCGGA